VSALPSTCCKPCCVQRSAHVRLWFLGSFPLYTTSACLSQLVPYGACCVSFMPGPCAAASWVGPAPASAGGSTVAYFNRPSCQRSLRGDIEPSLDASDDHRQILGPPSPLSVRHAYTPLTRSQPSDPLPVCCPNTTKQCSHSEQVHAAVTTFVGCFSWLWHVPWENGYKEVFWSLVFNGVRAAGTCQRFFSAPCPCGVVSSGAHGDCEQLRQHAFWECVAHAVLNQVQRGLEAH
jgi:hypothetical protein